jgi:hypothetical protein
MPNYHGARLYEVSIAIDDKLMAQPRLIVVAGQSGSLKVPETSVSNGFSVTIREDGSLLTKVVLVERGSVIGKPEILLAPNSNASVELASHERRIKIAVKNTIRDASLQAL